MTERFIEVSVVAKMFGVSYNTIRDMLDDPDNPLKGIRVGKACIRVLKSSIDELVETRMLDKQ
jgi:predicted DNA-binding transcriptional regulator AlpA